MCVCMCLIVVLKSYRRTWGLLVDWHTRLVPGGRPQGSFLLPRSLGWPFAAQPRSSYTSSMNQDENLALPVFEQSMDSMP